MAVKKIKKPKSNEPKLRFTVTHALACLYTLLLFTLFPIFQSNRYNATRRDRFTLFIILTLIAGAAVGGVLLATYLGRNNKYNKQLNTYRDPMRLTLTDMALGGFLLVSIISTLASGRISHCFLGLTYSNTNTGRNVGLLMILLMCIGYLIISRFFFNRKFVYYGIFIGITFIVGLAILNYHNEDPLGIFKYYEELLKNGKITQAQYDNTYQNFTSTIGNKNYLSALVCVGLTFSYTMAMVTKDKIMRVVAFVSTGVQFMGLLVATSDGGFLGFFVALAVLLVIASRDKSKLMWYFLGLAVMMLSAKLLSIFKDSSKGYSSFSSMFIDGGVTYAIMAVSFIIFGLLFFINHKNKSFELPSYLFYIVLGVIGAVVLTVTGMFIYYSAIDTTTVLAKDDFRRFFRYNDYWGTHRGFFWNRSFKIFGDMNFFEKLFGAGPETFHFKFEPYFGELYEMFKEGSCNAAHNVYINYLITHGIVGLAAYLTFLGAAITRAFKNAKNNPLSFVCLGVIVAYVAQDFVNISNPLNTPWLFVFIALSEACALKANSKEQLLATNF